MALNLLQAITTALGDASMPLSSKNICNQHFNRVLGWNQHCKLAHEEARDAYLLWRNSGIRKQGFLFQTMNKGSILNIFLGSVNLLTVLRQQMLKLTSDCSMMT